MTERTVFQSMAQRHVVSVMPTATVYAAACVMTRANCGSVLVIDASNTLLGIVTERDVVRLFSSRMSLARFLNAAVNWSCRDCTSAFCSRSFSWAFFNSVSVEASVERVSPSAVRSPARSFSERKSCSSSSDARSQRC